MKKTVASSQREKLRRRGPDPTPADLKDIPELTDEESATLYRPVKTSITVRIDGDVLAWLRTKGGKYQTHLNDALRHTMSAERKR